MIDEQVRPTCACNVFSLRVLWREEQPANRAVTVNAFSLCVDFPMLTTYSVQANDDDNNHTYSHRLQKGIDIVGHLTNLARTQRQIII